METTIPLRGRSIGETRELYADRALPTGIGQYIDGVWQEYTVPPLRGRSIGETRRINAEREAYADRALPTGIGQYVDGDWQGYVAPEDATQFGQADIDAAMAAGAAPYAGYVDPSTMFTQENLDAAMAAGAAPYAGYVDPSSVTDVGEFIDGVWSPFQDPTPYARDYVPEGYFSEEYWDPIIDGQVATGVSEAQSQWEADRNQKLVDMYGGSLEPDTGIWNPDPSSLVSTEIAERLNTIEDSIPPATDLSDLPDQITNIVGEQMAPVNEQLANYGVSLNALQQRQPVTNIYETTPTSRYATPSQAALGTLAEYQAPHSVFGTTQYAKPTYVPGGINSLLKGEPFSPTSPLSRRIKKAF